MSSMLVLSMPAGREDSPEGPIGFSFEGREEPARVVGTIETSAS